MWILPKNYQLSSRFAQDMVESREDLSLPGLNIESSLMWRSKPSLLRTWSQRWNRVPWFQRLSSRILKPSQRTSFETALTLSLEDIRVSRFQQQENDLEQKTQDTSGPTSLITSDQYDLFGASLKTSKDTSALDSEKSLATWKAQVIKQRGEYSARLKSAHLTRENEYTSWRTPAADQGGTPKALLEGKTTRPSGHKIQIRLQDQVKMWPTPTAHLAKEGGYPAEYTRNTASLTAFAIQSEGRPHSSGYLNPNWVEWLMGVPTGWTDLGSWGTE